MLFLQTGLRVSELVNLKLSDIDFTGIHVKRDSWVSVMYAEELNSGKSSVPLQRTDRHGSMGQKSADFQLSL
jgi:integrase